MSSAVPFRQEMKKVSIYAKLSLAASLLITIYLLVSRLGHISGYSRIWMAIIVYTQLPALIIGTVATLATAPAYFVRSQEERTWLDFICIIPMALVCINLITGTINMGA